MKQDLVFDVRKLKEIQHCIYYKRHLAHGTVGHNLLMLSAEIFEALGFGLDEQNLLTFEGFSIRGEDSLRFEMNVGVQDDWKLDG